MYLRDYEQISFYSGELKTSMSSDRFGSFISEDDIRIRVVPIWLADQGFTAESISVEQLSRLVKLNVK